MFLSNLNVSKRFFAWVSSGRNQAYERLVEQRKRSLFAPLQGTVVEIGAGAGANFPYYPRAIRYIALEPNPFMHPHLAKEARRLGIPIEILCCRAEEIALPDRSVDAVVGTLVLCSVRDPRKVLGEIRRILRPGGSYYFVEHVAAPRGSVLRKIQRFVRPLWRVISDGCTPDRETLELIRECGFSALDAETFHLSVPVSSPHIAGIAANL